MGWMRLTNSVNTILSHNVKDVIGSERFALTIDQPVPFMQGRLNGSFVFVQASKKPDYQVARNPADESCKQIRQKVAPLTTYLSSRRGDGKRLGMSHSWSHCIWSPARLDGRFHTKQNSKINKPIVKHNLVLAWEEIYIYDSFWMEQFFRNGEAVTFGD